MVVIFLISLLNLEKLLIEYKWYISLILDKKMINFRNEWMKVKTAANTYIYLVS